MLDGLPGGSDSKEPACNAGDLGSVIGLGRPPGEGKGNPFQYSFLEKSMDRGVHGTGYSSWGRKESDMTEQLTYIYTCVCVVGEVLVEISQL